MKKTWVLLSSLLIFTTAFSLVGCANTDDTPETTLSAQAQVLQERRDAVESYMRASVSVLWRAEEDITYHVGSGTREYKIVAGRLYRGVPYVYACGTRASFLEFAGEPDADGIYTISGLSANALTGGSTNARIGNDCSSALTAAWSVVSPTMNACTSQEMFEKYGVIPVGDYEFVFTESTKGTLESSDPIVEKNGPEVMFKAYAQAQKGDAVMHIKSTASGNNHARMVVSVNVVKTEDGYIDGMKSTITVLEQTRNNFNKELTTTLEATGETVYVIGGVDVEYTFIELFGEGYIPLTVKELVDADAPVADPVAKSSATEDTKDSILSDTVTANYFIDTVTVTITDSEGKQLQQASASVSRWSNKDFDMEKFRKDRKDTIRGSLNLDDLAIGSYHCTVVCRLARGDELTVRDFDFTV